MLKRSCAGCDATHREAFGTALASPEVCLVGLYYLMGTQIYAIAVTRQERV